ncbi:MAG: hypothetical protein OEW35_09680 [Gammaproteobacteria bacterium]|nr:hypothetical protein [Gammaproteobacteria bacterium]MDH4253634.1 hypothetical protein [Gammaproteobacteria bacterium]MDH5309750.1 hypothetical protein [Gammaproteobacteria bacterium]
MRRAFLVPVAATGMLAGLATSRAELDVHEDFYAGFAQGAYYGLLLAGEDYHVAWCMRGELEFEARGMGGGEEFQQTLDRLLAACRAAKSGGDTPE